jgi:hypothetical protein
MTSFGAIITTNTVIIDAIISKFIFVFISNYIVLISLK